jgi:methylmalonyl-CoA/ethylmalonyl-CoA epimerase
VIRVLGINHVGLAPKDPVKARWFFTEALGLPALGDELVAEQKTMTMMIGSSTQEGGAPINGCVNAQDRLEILAPHDKQGPIAQFLDKRGSGIHHVALSVADVKAAIAHLKAKGVRLIDESPRGGAHATQIAFVHPESTGGLLVELVQES